MRAWKLGPFVFFGLLSANPIPLVENAPASAGSATLRQEGPLLEVITSEHAVLDWSSFSIAPGETTRFIQPSQSSAVLNRVLGEGQRISEIFGSLESNGKIYLYNQQGIILGPEGIVRAPFFFATTREVRIDSFVQGEPFSLLPKKEAGAIELRSGFQIENGRAIFVGSRVQNQIPLNESFSIGEGDGPFLFDPEGSALLYIQPDLSLEELSSSTPSVSLAIGGNEVPRRVVTREGKVWITAENGPLSLHAMPMAPLAAGDINLSSPVDVNVNGSLSATGLISIESTGADINLASGITVSASGSVTLSAADTLNVGTGGTWSAGSTLSATGTQAFPLPVALSVSSGGASTFNGPAGITLSGSGTTLSLSVGSLTFANAVTGAAGFTITASSGNVVFQDTVTSDFISFSVAGSVSVESMSTAAAGSGTGISISAGGTFSVADNSTITSELGVGDSGLSVTAGAISLGDDITLESYGPLLMIANGSITSTGTLGTIQTLAAESVTLVADNSFPSPPGIGDGNIILPANFLLQTNSGLGGGALVYLYGSRLAQSQFPTTINGLAYTPGSQSADGFIRGTNEFVGYWYGDTIPSTSFFTILYKFAQNADLTPIPIQALLTALVEPVQEPDDNPEDTTPEPGVPKSNAGCVTPVSGVSAS